MVCVHQGPGIRREFVWTDYLQKGGKNLGKEWGWTQDQQEQGTMEPQGPGEDGFWGSQLLAFGGDATNPQWPNREATSAPPTPQPPPGASHQRLESKAAVPSSGT